MVGQLEIPPRVTAAAFRAARDHGAMTIVNPAPAPAIDRDLLDATEWLVPNEVEVEHLAATLGISAGRLSDQAMIAAI